MSEYDNIPEILWFYNQWVCWKYENRGENKLTKVPYDPTTGRFASVNDPDSWSAIETVRDYADEYDGIGFVLTQDDPFVFVDFDYTEEQFEIETQVEFHRKLDSYTERSPSGKGLHIVCRGSRMKGFRKNSIECYSHSRFMTVTGKVYGEPKPIRECPHELLELQERVASIVTSGSTTLNRPEMLNDREVFDAAMAAENGEKFHILWNGDTRKYHFGDQSRADFALIDIIAFYTQNRPQIKRMFRMSGLGQRDKAKRDDYLEGMINKAFDNLPQDIDVDSIRVQIDTFMRENFEAKKQIGEEFVIAHRPKVSDIVSPRERTPLKLDQGYIKPPPGLMGEIADFIFQQSFKPVPEISICAAIGMMAGICGRSYNVSGTGLNLYLLLLAGTGRGKDAISKGLNKLMHYITQMHPAASQFLGPADLASGQGMLRHMSDHQLKSYVSVFGEFAHKLESISGKNNNSAEKMLQRVLLDFFSKSGRHDVVLEIAYSDAEKNTKPIHCPAFSMIGESEPNRFYKMVNLETIASGLIPRYLVVEYKGMRPPSNFKANEVLPSTSLLEKMTSLVTASLTHLPPGPVNNVRLDVDADEMMRELDKAIDLKINESDIIVADEMWNRAHLNTLKVAALAAIGVNWFEPVIDATCFAWAQQVVCDTVQRLVDRFDGDSGEIISTIDNTSDARKIAKIEALICEWVTYDQVKCAKYGANAAMAHDRVIPYRFFYKRIRAGGLFNGAPEIKYTLQSLQEFGTLRQLSKPQAKQTYGFEGICYVLTNMEILNKIKTKGEG